MSKLIWLRILPVAVVIAACAHFQAREAAIPLRVLTYNIRAGNGDLHRTAETIRRLGPDIVGLQEVDVNWSERSAFEDQARSLGESLGMQVLFAPIYTLPGADSTKPARDLKSLSGSLGVSACYGGVGASPSAGRAAARSVDEAT